MAMRLTELTDEFARAVVQQTDAIQRGDAKTGNRHARKYLGVFEELRSHGDVGREALLPLFNHERVDVRVMAAAFLLRHRNAEAIGLLNEIAKGTGLAA